MGSVRRAPEAFYLGYPGTFCNKAPCRRGTARADHEIDTCPAAFQPCAPVTQRVFLFRPGLRAVPAPGIGVFLVGETGQHLIKGDLFMRLSPWIDGRRTQGQLVQALAGTLAEAEVIYGLEWLAMQGHLLQLSDGGTPAHRAAQDFWAAAGVNADGRSARSAEIDFLALGSAESAPISAALERAGLQARAGAALGLVVVDDALDPALTEVNYRALADGRPWLLLKPDGVLSWVGPLFEPGPGPCWECMAVRLRANRPVQTFLQRRGDWPDATPAAPPGLPAARALAADMAALMLARRAQHGRPADAARATLWTLDHRTGLQQAHRVLRRPQCPACGSPRPPQAAGQPRVALRPGLKRLALDGGHRTTPPEHTFERLRDHISPLTGIVASLGPLPGRPALRPVYAASYLVCPVDDAPAFDDFHRSALGKGKTAEQARASALCEALERWSAIAQGDETCHRASLRELGHSAVRPADLLNFSAAQYRERDALNRANPDPRRHVPLPPHDDQVMDWTPAWSLTDNRARYLPAVYCYSHYRVASDEALCSFNPNGHAAGNCLEEAVLQGFLELAERDAVALWWYSRALRPGVDLASFHEPYFDALVAHYAAMGWQLWVLDITTDLAVPSFVGLARCLADARTCIGFGSHLDAALAVQRALTEVNQLFGLDPTRTVPWSEDTLEREDFLFPAPTLPARTRADFPDDCPEDLRDEVLACVERARRIGLETLVVDLSRADVDLAVAKVVVPGLRHFWPRFGPGRLYDAPAAMGWLARPLTEAELNPAHLFL